MRTKIAILIAGIVLGSAATGAAATSWIQKGTTYSCTGSSLSVFCKETNWKTNYEVAIFPSRIAVSYGSGVIFACKRKKVPADNCEYFGR